MTINTDGWLPVQTNTSLGLAEYIIDTEPTPYGFNAPILKLHSDYKGMDLTGTFVLLEDEVEQRYPDVMDVIETLANIWGKNIEMSIEMED